MSSKDKSVRTRLASYWQDKGLYISPDLLDHEEFLLKFSTTGDIEQDVTTFLNGVGRNDMLATHSQYGFQLQGLATAILEKHQEELANLKQGNRPIWSARYQHWSQEQLDFYRHLLEMEKQVLDAILTQGAGQCSPLMMEPAV